MEGELMTYLQTKVENLKDSNQTLSGNKEVLNKIFKNIENACSEAKCLILEVFGNLLNENLEDGEKAIFVPFSNYVLSFLHLELQPDWEHLDWKAHFAYIKFLSSVMKNVADFIPNHSTTFDFCSFPGLRKCVLNALVTILTQCKNGAQFLNKERQKAKCDSLNELFQESTKYLKYFLQLWIDNTQVEEKNIKEVKAVLENLLIICECAPEVDLSLMNCTWKLTLNILQKTRGTSLNSNLVNLFISLAINFSKLGFCNVTSALYSENIEKIKDNKDSINFSREIKLVRYYLTQLFVLCRDFPEVFPEHFNSVLELIVLAKIFGAFSIYSKEYSHNTHDQIQTLLMTCIDSLYFLLVAHDKWCYAELQYVTLPQIVIKGKPLKINDTFKKFDSIFPVNEACEFSKFLLSCHLLTLNTAKKNVEHAIKDIVQYMRTNTHWFCTTIEVALSETIFASLYDYVQACFMISIKRAICDNEWKWVELFLFNNILSENVIALRLVVDIWQYLAKNILNEKMLNEQIKSLLFLREHADSLKTSTFFLELLIDFLLSCVTNIKLFEIKPKSIGACVKTLVACLPDDNSIEVLSNVISNFLDYKNAESNSQLVSIISTMTTLLITYGEKTEKFWKKHGTDPLEAMKICSNIIQRQDVEINLWSASVKLFSILISQYCVHKSSQSFESWKLILLVLKAQTIAIERNSNCGFASGQLLSSLLYIPFHRDFEEVVAKESIALFHLLLQNNDWWLWICTANTFSDVAKFTKHVKVVPRLLPSPMQKPILSMFFPTRQSKIVVKNNNKEKLSRIKELLGQRSFSLKRKRIGSSNDSTNKIPKLTMEIQDVFEKVEATSLSVEAVKDLSFECSTQENEKLCKLQKKVNQLIKELNDFNRKLPSAS